MIFCVRQTFSCFNVEQDKINRSRFVCFHGNLNSSMRHWNRVRQVPLDCRQSTLKTLINQASIQCPSQPAGFCPEAVFAREGKSARRLLPGGSLCPKASQPAGILPGGSLCPKASQPAGFCPKASQPAGFCPEAVFARRQVSPEASARQQSLPEGKSARRLLAGAVFARRQVSP